MSSMEARLAEADAAVKTDTQRAEQIYKSLLEGKAGAFWGVWDIGDT